MVDGSFSLLVSIHYYALMLPSQSFFFFSFELWVFSAGANAISFRIILSFIEFSDALLECSRNLSSQSCATITFHLLAVLPQFLCVCIYYIIYICLHNVCRSFAVPF